MMSNEQTQTVMMPIWSVDTGYTSSAAAKIVAVKCGCSEENANELFKMTQNAIKRLQENSKTKDLFPTDTKNPHPLSDIYFGSPDNRRMGQAFIDATTGKSRVFLEPVNLLQDFQKSNDLTAKDKEDVLCYLIAHELEHTCQGQRAPILETINKQNPSDKANKSPKFETHLLDTVIEADAAAVGLVAAQNCGISEKALNYLQRNYFSWLPNIKESLSSDRPDAFKERELTKKIQETRESYWQGKEFKYSPSLAKASKYPDVFSETISMKRDKER